MVRWLICGWVRDGAGCQRLSVNLQDQTRRCVSLLLLEEGQEFHAQVDHAGEIDGDFGVKGLGVELGWDC